MGKRQKRVQGEDGEVGGAHMPDDQVEQQPLENAAPKTQLVGASTLQYLTEISEALKGLEEGSEERQLLLANVLDELSGQEVRVATDPVCSRLMEGLLTAAPIPHVCSFIGAAAEREALYELASSPFGSHVLERALSRLHEQLEQADEEAYDAAAGMLQSLTELIAADLQDYLTNCFATHVARSLLRVLCGRDVVPRSGKGPTAAAAAQEAAAAGEPGAAPASAAGQPAQKLHWGGGGSGGGGTNGGAPLMGLAAKMHAEAQVPGGAAINRFPKLVARLVARVTGQAHQGLQLQQLAMHQYAGPFLQGLLRAVAGDRRSLVSLVPSLLGATFFVDSAKAGKALEGVQEEAVQALMMDATGSRLMEAVLASCSKDLVDEIWSRFLKGKLGPLVDHPVANFVVQAALAATSSAAQLQPMLQELAPLLGQALLRRRSGVAAALVAAAARTGSWQKEVCAALAEALRHVIASTPGAGAAPKSGAGNGATDASSSPAQLAQLVATLLALDTNAQLQAASPGSSGEEAASAAAPSRPPAAGGYMARLSPPGCAMMVAILRFPQAACRAFTDGLLALPPSDLGRLGRDPGGTRVLEAALDGGFPQRLKQQLLGKMAGHYGAIALTAPGSYLIEKAYTWSEGPAKEIIVSELAASGKQLEAARWGPGLIRKCGVEIFRRDPQQWRRHSESAAKTLQQYAQLFGSDAAGSSGGGGGKGGKRGGKAVAEAAVEEGAGDARPSSKKRRVQADGEAEEAQAGPGGAAGAAEGAAADAAAAGGTKSERKEERRRRRKEERQQRKQARGGKDGADAADEEPLAQVGAEAETAATVAGAPRGKAKKQKQRGQVYGDEVDRVMAEVLGFGVDSTAQHDTAPGVETKKKKKSKKV